MIRIFILSIGRSDTLTNKNLAATVIRRKVMDIKQRTNRAKEELKNYSSEVITLAEYISYNAHGNTHPIAVAEIAEKITDEVKSFFKTPEQIKSGKDWDAVFDLTL